VLLQRGPQYPFQPFELTYLRSVVGSIRGTELNQPVDLPEVSEEQRAEALKMYKGDWNCKIMQVAASFERSAKGL